jgi:NADH-quinone oxidoreductase subunit H
MVTSYAQLFLSPLVALVMGVILMGLMRVLIARIHWRYGPPILQPVIDIIRLFSQKSASHGAMFDFGLVLSLAGSLAVILFMPLGTWCPLGQSGGLLVILYLMLLMPFGTALSGGAGANPNISIGISRKLILSLAYEIPFLLIVLAVMHRYGSISLIEITHSQQDSGWAMFSWQLVLPGIAYILVLPAMLGVRPFDVAGAPQEISSGPMVEYGGKYLALEHIEHALSLTIGLALFVNLFLGGASNVGFLFLKMLAVFLVGFGVHAVFPRLRVEQAVGYLWKWPTGLALIGLIIVVLAK